MSALAADTLPPEETLSTEETSSPEEIFPEEAPLPEDEAEPDLSPTEEFTEESEAEETIETAFSDEPLLKTGGHDTYLGGYPGALFKPDKYMNRAEVAQMLYNLLNSKPAVSQSKFSDVVMDKWYGTAVNTLAEVGVLSGYSDGTFLPGKTITRAEFVTALSRCFSMEAGTSSFTDVPETHWAYPYICAATTAGWINGVSEGIFRPNRGIKRSEAVKIMNVALGRKDDGFAADRATQKFYDVSPSHWAYLDICEAAKPDEPITPPGPSTNPDTFTVGASVIVMASALNLRSAPSTSASVVTVLSQNSILTITDISTLPSSWLGVKSSTGATGFVSTGPTDDPYVVLYTPGQVSGASLSSASLSLHQYQTIRLDGSIGSGKLSEMKWTSSDPTVAEVDYQIDYGNSRTEGAMIYGKKPGTTVITYSDAAGTTSAKCTVTVTAAEPVRYAYPSENAPLKNQACDLIAITDTSRSSVTFTVTGPARGTFTTKSFTTESRTPKKGHAATTVRVFKHNVTFTATGTYTVKVTADNAGSYEFTVLVRDSESSSTVTAFAERRCSTEGLKIIANFEGSVPEIEDDRISRGNPTVGYGNVVQKNEAFYNNLTTSELYAMLVAKVNDGGYAAAVNRFRSTNNIRMSQAQFDALVSLVYNCGSGPLGTDKGVNMAMINAVVPPAGLSASTPRTGVLNVSGYSMYPETSVSSPALCVVPSGASVQVIGSQVIAEKKEVWYQITYTDKTTGKYYTGWIPAGVVKLSGSDLVHDFTYADSTVVANNMLQWNKSGGQVYAGLLWRRMAEAKIFFYGNYAEAYHSHANYQKNTYGFIFPDDCKQYDYR